MNHYKKIYKESVERYEIPFASEKGMNRNPSVGDGLLQSHLRSSDLNQSPIFPWGNSNPVPPSGWYFDPVRQNFYLSFPAVDPRGQQYHPNGGPKKPYWDPVRGWTDPYSTPPMYWRPPHNYPGNIHDTVEGEWSPYPFPTPIPKPQPSEYDGNIPPTRIRPGIGGREY